MNKTSFLMIATVFITIGAAKHIFCVTPKIEKLEYTLTQGETFMLELQANPSTGYVWGILVNQPSKERWIELIKSEYKPDKPGRIGGGGTLNFTFKAMKSTGSASYDVPLYYCRPQSGKIAKIISLVVEIKPKEVEKN